MGPADPLAASALTAILHAEAEGQQRLSLEKLKRWEALGYGMFLHFGMSTFSGQELSDGNSPNSLYAPTHLDVDQWVAVARDSGMRYAVLTAKHVAGHCLWPTKWTEYNVSNSSVKTDVIDAFVKACRKYGILPGIYYCSWDNHNRFGSFTGSDIYALPADQQMQGPGGWASQAFTTRAYQDFQWRQLEELLTLYGPIAEIWIDIPGFLPRAYRNALYQQMAAWQPDAVVVMNGGGAAPVFPVAYSWPTDVATLERSFPNSRLGYDPMRKIEGKVYYLPGEACDTLTHNWFYQDHDPLRSDAELCGMYAVTRARGANFLLDVGPDRTGQIAPSHVKALQRLTKNIGVLGGFI
jgi:alpha-L-fucosidase